MRYFVISIVFLALALAITNVGSISSSRVDRVESPVAYAYTSVATLPSY